MTYGETEDFKQYGGKLEELAGNFQHISDHDGGSSFIYL
jgi:hypothetical protein